MHQSFLENVADSLCKLSTNLEDVLVVVPNRRSTIYLDKILSQKLDLAILPELVTMQQLIEKASKNYIADSLLLNTKLHKLFTKLLGTEESLDQFYNWGEMLLNDFEEIDKNLIHAESLFSTLLSSKEIDRQFSFLSEEEAGLLQRFWHTYKNPYSKEQEAFLNTWQQLYAIYKQFKQQLQKEKLAYAGMAFKEVAENPEQLHTAFSFEKIAFVGFHLLNNAEKALFQHFKTNAQALFYWQADNLYIANKSHEAGFGLRDYVKDFPSEIPLSDNLSSKKIEVDIIAVGNYSSEAVEAVSYVDKKTSTTASKLPEVGIILPDESLLQPLLSEFSPNTPVNVSMGFPFTQTAFFEFLHLLKDASNVMQISNNVMLLPATLAEHLQNNLVNVILSSQTRTKVNSMPEYDENTEYKNIMPYFVEIEKSNLCEEIKTILSCETGLSRHLQKLTLLII